MSHGVFLTLAPALAPTNTMYINCNFLPTSFFIETATPRFSSRYLELHSTKAQYRNVQNRNPHLVAMLSRAHVYISHTCTRDFYQHHEGSGIISAWQVVTCRARLVVNAFQCLLKGSN